jgi:hypothetical protein
MKQVIEQLPRKCEALISNASAAEKRFIWLTFDTRTLQLFIT